MKREIGVLAWFGVFVLVCMHHFCEVLQVSVPSLNYYFAKVEVAHCTWLSHINKRICHVVTTKVTKNATCPQENDVEFVTKMLFHDLATVWGLIDVFLSSQVVRIGESLMYALVGYIGNAWSNPLTLLGVSLLIKLLCSYTIKDRFCVMLILCNGFVGIFIGRFNVELKVHMISFAEELYGTIMEFQDTMISPSMIHFFSN